MQRALFNLYLLFLSFIFAYAPVALAGPGEYFVLMAADAGSKKSEPSIPNEPDAVTKEKIFELMKTVAQDHLQDMQDRLSNVTEMAKKEMTPDCTERPSASLWSSLYSTFGQLGQFLNDRYNSVNLPVETKVSSKVELKRPVPLTVLSSSYETGTLTKFDPQTGDVLSSQVYTTHNYTSEFPFMRGSKIKVTASYDPATNTVDVKKEVSKEGAISAIVVGSLPIKAKAQWAGSTKYDLATGSVLGEKTGVFLQCGAELTGANLVGAGAGAMLARGKTVCLQEAEGSFSAEAITKIAKFVGPTFLQRLDYVNPRAGFSVSEGYETDKRTESTVKVDKMTAGIKVLGAEATMEKMVKSISRPMTREEKRDRDAEAAFPDEPGKADIYPPANLIRKCVDGICHWFAESRERAKASGGTADENDTYSTTSSSDSDSYSEVKSETKSEIKKEDPPSPPLLPRPTPEDQQFSVDEFIFRGN